MKTIELKNKYSRMLSIPAIIVLLIIAFKVCIWTATLVRYFLGDWGMILGSPLYFKYIISPIWDNLQEWYENKF